MRRLTTPFVHDMHEPQCALAGLHLNGVTLNLFVYALLEVDTVLHNLSELAHDADKLHVLTGSTCESHSGFP